MLINFKKEEIKFCLVGSGKLCCKFSKMLSENGFQKPVIVTWNKKLHERDQTLMKKNENYEDVFSFSKNNNIKLIQSQNINNSETITLLKKENINFIFSIKSRWIIKQHLIDEFNGLVINIHQGYLPYERGSVTYQKIMNNYNVAGVTIHKVSETVDGGNILYRKTINIDKTNLTIDQMNSANYKISVNLLEQLIIDIKSGNEIKEIVQNNNKSIYMPQFYSKTNGAIDWGWDAEDIDAFIRAFGHPMPGAFTFYNNEKVKLLESYVEISQKNYHPYFNGRIVTANDDGSLRVITKKHYLIISLIRIGDFVGIPAEKISINSNAVFHTPKKILEDARTKFTWSLKMEPPD